MRSRYARIVASAVLAVTWLTACSGDPKQDFIDAADAICREADQRIDEVGAPVVEDEVREYVEDAKEIAGDLVDDLRELEPPEADQERIERMIEGFERSIDLLDPLADAAAEGDTKALQDLQEEVTQVTEEVSEIARSYGFETCGAKVLDPGQ